jgi:HK97 family phage major capsid protein
MADTSGMADIRGIDIDKLAKGFADEENVFKKFCTQTSTSAREMRWYKKTAGFLDSTDTTAITASQIANVSDKSRPVVVEQSWTRQTSYIRKYFVESPLISEEDIKDTDIDIIGTLVRDLTRSVERQVDQRIINVITENYTPTNIQTTATVAPWDTVATCNPVLDLLKMQQMIRAYSYEPQGAILAMNSIEHKNLLNFLISVKGSSIPAFASNKLETGVVMELLGFKIIVSENVTTDYAVAFVSQRAATWKSFIPITSVKIEDKGIGTKIRVWEEGECLLTDPKAVVLLTNTAA